MSNGKSIRDAIKAAGDTPKKSNPYKKDVLYTSEGQWKYPGQVTKVPGGNITMQGVPYPVLGVDNHGNQQMMMPNMNYHFPGQYVTEYPIDLDIRGNLEHIHGNIGANFGRNRIDLSMGTPTHEFNPRFGVKYTRTFNYGGDPSLPAITGHYPFGGMYSKTHTHMQDGGWLDEYEEGGEKPWGEMTPQEKAAYLDAKEKKKPMSKAQADAWAKQAEAKSRAQAKKEYYEDYVREGTKKALTHPLFQAPGMAYAATIAPVAGLIASAPGLYESGKNIVKGEGDWSDYANIGLTALGIKGVAPNIKNTYNKVATGNSVLPVAWKMEQVADDVTSFKNKYDLTNEEAIVLGKYINSPYNLERGTVESQIFDNLVKRNKAILDDVKTPVTKVLNHSTTSDKDVIPTKFGSKFTFPGNRSWSLGVDPRFVNTDRTRLVIPSKYTKDLDFLGVPYEDARLAEGWNIAAKAGNKKNNNLTNLQNMASERELIGNIPEGYKVIGSSNEGGFKNVFIKPIKVPYKAYGGDPSLPNIEGHYPFGGIHTKTHTHFRRGGWLDELQNGGGPNLGIDPPPSRTASNVGAVNEDELFEQYNQLRKQLEEEQKQVSKVRGNLIPVAKALDEADSRILANKESAAYKAFIKSRYASTPEELKKAIQEYPEELRNVLPGRGSYNIALADPKKYKSSDELYCTPYGCFTYQKAGAKDVPIVAGNFGFVGGVKEGKLPFKKVSASEAEPGDMAIVYGLQPADYRGDPTAEWIDRPHHTTVLAGKPTFDKKGKVVGFPMYNADEGNRLSYEKAYRDAAAKKDSGYEFYRYVGQTPKYEEELKNIKSRLASLPIEPMPIKAQDLLIQEEPELELRQTGGGYFLSNQAYDTIPETTGVYKRKIPSLDTLKKQAAKQAARPWKDWSPEEKERYIKNPPKKMTPAQAEEWNKRAEEWSSTQAKKEHTEDYIKESTRKAVVENPMWNTAVSFTPAGMIGSLMKGVANAGPDIYKTIKNPTSVTNYANIADDILSMAHIPESAIGFKSLANIKKIGLPGTNQGLTVGDVKKLYSTEKKFQKKEDTTGKKHPSGMTDAQISAYINKSYTPFGQMEEGGWLDEYFRGGSGPMMLPGLRKKVRKKGTSKNIQSSVNKLFLRNYDLFGPSGKNVYNPNSKYESGGGWLDNLE